MLEWVSSENVTPRQSRDLLRRTYQADWRFRGGFAGQCESSSMCFHRTRKLLAEFVKGGGATFRRFTCIPITATSQSKGKTMSRSRIPFKLCLAFLLGTVLMSGTAKAGNPFQRIANHIGSSAFGHGSVGSGYSSYWRLPSPPRPHCGPIRPPVHPPVYPPIVQPICPPIYPPPIFCPPYGHCGPGLTPHPSPWGGYRHGPRTY